MYIFVLMKLRTIIMQLMTLQIQTIKTIDKVNILMNVEYLHYSYNKIVKIEDFQDSYSISTVL